MSSRSLQSVLIMAGGTGGHVFPALAAADCLREEGINVQWLGTKKGIESKLVPAADIPIHYINVSGLRGKGLLSLLKAPVNIISAVFQALQVIRQLKPDCVLGMGGFVSGPGGVAAWLTRRPLVIHEQNAVAGTTNRLLANLATRVLKGYPITLGGKKGLFIGNPVREQIANIVKPEQRWVDDSKELKLLVLGGSLGSKPINDVLLQTLTQLSESDRPNIWHQAGAAHVDQVSQAYCNAHIDAKVEAFIGDMASAYSWADLVLCRAGALTVAELTAAGVASILVPLPHAIDDHQTQNARWLSEKQAAILLKQASMSAQGLAKLLLELTRDRSRLLAMAKSARQLAKVDAAQQVAAHCLEVARV
ncbi:MAG: undecaprenyldiphospho-muramoylpentapeptide beta-N-acetylglucosaminyltransferase [Spongiibacteraceae bacterium]|nr:undecaprenyldiphospho-muramoylpentapeptide beta-N-acetylglucosaminyltransferase [Spongiibacteraceae bacterium]